MIITRRNAITVATVLGVDAVVRKARADLPGAEPEQFELLWAIGFGIWTVWKSLPENAKADIWDAAKSAINGTGRTASVTDDNPSSTNVTSGVAHLRLAITKRGDGTLNLSSHLDNIDGGGQPHFSLSGAAPSHRHPDFHAHLNSAVSRTHAFLRSRNH